MRLKGLIGHNSTRAGGRSVYLCSALEARFFLPGREEMEELGGEKKMMVGWLVGWLGFSVELCWYLFWLG